jgi:hypothetical protein
MPITNLFKKTKKSLLITSGILLPSLFIVTPLCQQCSYVPKETFTLWHFDWDVQWIDVDYGLSIQELVIYLHFNRFNTTAINLDTGDFHNSFDGGDPTKLYLWNDSSTEPDPDTEDLSYSFKLSVYGDNESEIINLSFFFTYRHDEGHPLPPSDIYFYTISFKNCGISKY